MFNIDAMTTFKIEPEEYGEVIEYASYSSRVAKVYINKIMPKITKGMPTILPSQFTPNIFCNDVSNIPTVGVQVLNTQNFITVNINQNSDNYNKGLSDGGIPAGSKINCRIMYNNIRNIYATNIL